MWRLPNSSLVHFEFQREHSNGFNFTLFQEDPVGVFLTKLRVHLHYLPPWLRRHVPCTKRCARIRARVEREHYHGNLPEPIPFPVDQGDGVEAREPVGARCDHGDGGGVRGRHSRSEVWEFDLLCYAVEEAGALHVVVDGGFRVELLFEF